MMPAISIDAYHFPLGKIDTLKFPELLQSLYQQIEKEWIEKDEGLRINLRIHTTIPKLTEYEKLKIRDRFESWLSRNVAGLDIGRRSSRKKLFILIGSETACLALLTSRYVFRTSPIYELISKIGLIFEFIFWGLFIFLGSIFFYTFKSLRWREQKFEKLRYCLNRLEKLEIEVVEDEEIKRLHQKFKGLVDKDPYTIYETLWEEYKTKVQHSREKFYGYVEKFYGQRTRKVMYKKDLSPFLTIIKLGLFERIKNIPKVYYMEEELEVPIRGILHD